MIFYLFSSENNRETPIHSPQRRFAAGNLTRSGVSIVFPIKTLVEERRAFAAELERLAGSGYPVKKTCISTQSSPPSASGRDFRKEWKAICAEQDRAEKERDRIYETIRKLNEAALENYKEIAESWRKLSEETLVALTPKQEII